MTIRFLLVEPQSLVRSTVVAVARELRLATLDDTANLDAAALRLASARYDGMLLSLDGGQDRALELLQRLRASELATPADVPVVVMAGACDADLALRMKQLQVSRLLIKPFKVKTVLETIDALSERVWQQVEA